MSSNDLGSSYAVMEAYGQQNYEQALAALQQYLKYHVTDIVPMLKTESITLPTKIAYDLLHVGNFVLKETYQSKWQLTYNQHHWGVTLRHQGDDTWLCITEGTLLRHILDQLCSILLPEIVIGDVGWAVNYGHQWYTYPQAVNHIWWYQASTMIISNLPDDFPVYVSPWELQNGEDAYPYYHVRTGRADHHYCFDTIVTTKKDLYQLAKNILVQQKLPVTSRNCQREANMILNKANGQPLTQFVQQYLSQQRKTSKPVSSVSTDNPTTDEKYAKL